MAADTIPVVDFGASLDDPRLAGEVVGAFRSVGFVYIVNHGVDAALVERTHAAARSFFSLPRDVKARYARREPSNHGWVALGTEALNPARPGDLKEAFNVTATQAGDAWPTAGEVPGFKETLLDLQARCDELAHKVMYLMGLGLGLDDPAFFMKQHSPAAAGVPSYSTLRCLYYPPPPAAPAPGALRCGEHSDYGSITLLFQDEAGGLQVKGRGTGEWTDAPPRPGAVIVNVGDLMQRWTADVLVSTPHRVIVPPESHDKPGPAVPRQSIAYFFHPDDAVVVSPVDGSDKYPPISAAEYTQQRFSATY